MKIAFISLGAPWGGSEVLWSKTAGLALEQGHDVFVSVYRFDKVPDSINILKEMGAVIHFREKYNPDQLLLKKIKSYIKTHCFNKTKVYSELWKFNPNNIFISQGSSFALLVHHYGLFEDIRKHKVQYSIICHSHSQYSSIPDKNIYPRGKELFLKANYVFFVSNRQKSLIERSLCTKLENAMITWNPLNLKEKKYLNWSEMKTAQFAMVGDLAANKGHDTLFEILSHKEWQSRDWHLNIYGKGYGRKYLENLANFLNIREKVSFHGYVNEIETVWKNNHILLIPSAGEGLPISLCEAMVCGRPAVVTDVGGNSEVIEENKTGFIAEAPTVISFSKALEKAWKIKVNWEKMGKKSSEFAMTNIDLSPEKKVLKRLLKI